MAILRDAKGGIFRIQLCKYCTDIEGKPKPILPTDTLAHKEKDGSYKCGICIQDEIDTSIIKANPNSAKSQEIIKRRNREAMIDKMNRQLYERSRR